MWTRDAARAPSDRMLAYGNSQARRSRQASPGRQSAIVEQGPELQKLICAWGHRTQPRPGRQSSEDPQRNGHSCTQPQTPAVQVSEMHSQEAPWLKHVEPEGQLPLHSGYAPPPQLLTPHSQEMPVLTQAESGGQVPSHAGKEPPPQ